MKKYGRIFLTLAILFGLAAQAQATSYDPTNLTPPTANNLVRMNQGGQGDALIGEFYRATVGTNFEGELDNANFLTYVSIVNTSGDWVAAHVRLRTGRYSIEAIDFPILLSPHDVFWFQFEASPLDGDAVTAVRIFSQDTGTLVRSGLPVDDNGIWEDDLSNSILSSFTRLPAEQRTVQELAIGYVEVIGLWRLAYANGGRVPESELPSSNNFNNLQQAFYNAGFSRIDPSNLASRVVVPRDLGNVLTGQVFMGDFTNGLYTGYAMTALADFRSDCQAVRHRDGVIRGYRVADRGAIIYNVLGFNNAARIDPAYTDPDWATSFGPTWNDGDDWNGTAIGAADSYSLDEVDDALAKQKVTSTYFNGGFRLERSTFSMATITFPTKYLHFFFTYRTDPALPLQTWPVGQPASAANARGLLNVAGIGNVSLFGRIFDLDENEPFDAVSPHLMTNLKWEVNCVPIGALSRAKLEEFCFLTHEVGPIDVDGSFYAGWFELMGFGLLSGDANVDPRNGTAGYNRAALPLLNCLQSNVNSRAFALNQLIPAMVQTLDFEFANFLHARSFVPGFDNPNNCPQPTAPLAPICPDSVARDFN